MTAPHDRLRAALHDLADAAEPADLYREALHASRRIALREATIGTVTALVALGLLASGLWRNGHSVGEPRMAALPPSPSVAQPPPYTIPPVMLPRPAISRRTTMSAGSAARRHDHRRLGASPAVAKPRSRSLADLPGQVFYARPGAITDVVRMSPDDGASTTVLVDTPSPVGISPDGSRIAYVRDRNLMVTRTGERQVEQVAAGVATTVQAPAWSPDGERLLVDASTPAIVHVATGTLTPLPDRLGQGQHFRWSGDGSKLVFATSYCGLQVAGSADGSGTSVPVLGDPQPADNPHGWAACKPTSVDVTGQRVTVPLQTTGETGSDGPDTADAVVDTVTGEVIPLPITGAVVGTVFGPDGNLLVRAVSGATTALSLFAPDGTLLVQATEPAPLRDLDLLAYTR